MWLRVALRNYRSIESAEVELAPFSVLAGPTSSGKSNFVDALVLASELGLDAPSAVRRRGGLQALRRWGVPEAEALQVRIRHSARHEILDRVYAEQSFSLIPEEGRYWRFQDESFTLTHDQLSTRFTRESWQPGEGPWLQNSSLVLEPTASLMSSLRQRVFLNVPQVRRLEFDPGRMRAPQPPGQPEVLREDGSNLTSVLERLRDQDARGFASVLAAMRRLVPGLEDLFVEELGGLWVLRFSQRQGSRVARFTASHLSEGALRALGIILAAQTFAPLSPSAQPSPPDMLILEEPETRLPAQAMAVIFEVLKRASPRGLILVTTHSPELIAAAREEELRVCVYRDGVTQVRPEAAGTTRLRSPAHPAPMSDVP